MRLRRRAVRALEAAAHGGGVDRQQRRQLAEGSAIEIIGGKKESLLGVEAGEFVLDEAAQQGPSLGKWRRVLSGRIGRGG